LQPIASIRPFVELLLPGRLRKDARMPGNPHTSVRSRTVAAELRRLRERRGLSCAEVAKTLGVSASKISRIETGNSGMQIEDVAALLGFYQVPDPKREELLDLLRRRNHKGWWERQAGLPHLWRTLIDFENKATRIHNYEYAIIPGLLQTAEYSAAMIRATDATLSDAELDNLVASRMARQTLLTRARAPHLMATVHETALRMPAGGHGVMKRQLQQLMTLTERSNIELRVVPMKAGAHVGLRGPFMMLEFVEEPTLVFVENQNMGLFLEDEADILSYRVALTNILSVALPTDATADLIRSIAAEWT
jgi:transcriptional regulator with XRE-family HTH domain